jgi:ADP-ribose pyrophosphatase YjhB (NUDIX family)
MTAVPAAGPPTASASLVELLRRYPVLHPPVSTAGAAVTIVLRDGADDVETLLIERATNPDDPASGHVALPGGRVEESDGSLASTALRELREEVGLVTADFAGPLRFVGASPARRFGVHVGVFAAAIAATGGPPTIGDPDEVAHVFWLPRKSLSESRLVTQAGERGPIRVFASVHEGHVVWGFTRRILREFFGLPQEDQPLGPVVSQAPAEPVAPRDPRAPERPP